MRGVLVPALVVVVVLAGTSRRARAYPQYQLSRDQTCSGCHVSPAGGNLLGENGMLLAEQNAQFSNNPAFMYGALDTGDSVMLGGDFRSMSGYLQTPQRYLVWFPMQADVYVAAHKSNFSLHVTAGYRPPEYRNENATRVWSREHYVMWQQEEGSPYGVFVRLGRFMPVFGLRLAEHPDYTRRFGGTPLYGETYAVAAEYITEKLEGHFTGFVKDPLIDPVRQSNGAAAYGELRVTKEALVGVEGMVEVTTDDKKFRGGVTGKYYLPSADLLFQGEFQFVNQRINGPMGGGAPISLVGYAMASKFVGKATMIDLGLGHYDENVRIHYLDRDCVDLNVHWFVDSHVELSLNARIEVIGQLNGGPTGAYAFAQAHYRL